MNPTQALDRRDFFHWGINGLGVTALASLLASENTTASDRSGPRVAKAKRTSSMSTARALMPRCSRG